MYNPMPKTLCSMFRDFVIAKLEPLAAEQKYINIIKVVLEVTGFRLALTKELVDKCRTTKHRDSSLCLADLIHRFSEIQEGGATHIPYHYGMDCLAQLAEHSTSHSYDLHRLVDLILEQLDYE